MVEYESLEPSKALSRLSHPVVIVTARTDDKMNGMTAAWASQISIEPPIMCVSISPLRYTWELLKEAENFGISVLGEGQERIAEVFGTTSGRNSDKFKVLGMEPFFGYGDVPLIPGSIAAFVCRKKDEVEQGDHFAVFGEVVEAWEGQERPPLRWFRSKYHM